MQDLNLNIEPNEGGTLPILLSDILNDPGVNMAIRWSQYLASLLFYPFASLLSTFLYFDLAQRQKVINLDHLEQFSNHLFGTDLNQKKDVRKTPSEEEVKCPPVTDIIDTDPSKEDKDK